MILKFLKKKRKASIVVEFIVFLPFFVFCVWCIINLMMYLNAQSTIHQAAIMSAEAVSEELRGHIDGATGLEGEIKTNIETEVRNIVSQTTLYNSMLDLGRNVQNDSFSFVFEEKCDDVNTVPVICIETNASGSSNLTTGSGHDIVGVKIVAHYTPIGGYGNLFKNLTAQGFGFAALDQAERFQYMNGE